MPLMYVTWQIFGARMGDSFPTEEKSLNTSNIIDKEP